LTDVELKPWQSVDFEYINVHLLVPLLKYLFRRHENIIKVSAIGVLVFAPGKESIAKASAYLRDLSA